MQSPLVFALRSLGVFGAIAFAVRSGGGELPDSGKLDWHDAGAARRHLNRVLDTKDDTVWEPVIGELMNPQLRQTEAIAILEEVLDNPDWRVGIRAAQELLDLGSNAGVPKLRLALKAAATGTEIPPIMVLTAASALLQAGEAINAQDLKSLFQQNGPHAYQLLQIAAQQDAPWVPDAVRAMRIANANLFHTEEIAGYVGMSDRESIQRYDLLLTLRPQDKVLGNWAHYRATGDVSHLQYVIDVVRELDGLAPPTEKSAGGAGVVAYQLLRITPGQVVRAFLEDLADKVAGKENIRSIGSTGALASLYSVHHDYAFVDQHVLGYFRGSYPANAGTSELLWRVASLRRTPEIEKLAAEKSRIYYELYFLRMPERPVPNSPVSLPNRN